MESKSKKLSVLIAAYCVDKADVGGSKMAYEWITRLSEYVDICVITTGSRFHEVTGLEDHNNVKQIILKPRLSFKKWDAFDRAAQPGYIEFFFRAYKVAQKCASNGNFDLCHQVLPRSPRYPSPFIGIDIPMVIGPFHGGMKSPAVMKYLEVKDSWMFKLKVVDDFRMRYDLFLRKHFAKAKRLVISAPYVRELLLPKNREKCVVIPPPPSFEVKANQLDKYHRNDDILKMVYVGRLVPSKGLELLFLAMAKCKNKNVKLAIYGRGSGESGYRSMVENLNLADRVTWKGFVPSSEVIKGYDLFDLFIFPSLKEPTGIALTEAMAVGLPVVCIDTGGPAYIVTPDCGIKIPVTTKDQMITKLAEAIDTMANDPEKRCKMGMCAYDRITENFTWDVAVGKMLKIYDEIIKDKAEDKSEDSKILCTCNKDNQC